MKRTLRLWSFALLGAVALSSLPALGGCGHTHSWVWHRTETEHWLECSDPACGETMERGMHADDAENVCEDCAQFRAIAFGFDEGGDTAHADFAQEANKWFPEKGKELGFLYEYAGNDFSKLNDEDLANYDLVIFLNDRPHVREQQEAFERFMEGGGAWIGFHSCAFSLVDEADKDREGSDYWRWYQDEFLRCGNYAKNTWNPTSEPLTVETFDHCATRNLPKSVFDSAPCEWYAWEYDLLNDPEVTVLLTLNPTEENPAGDNPHKAYEIWHDGHYPIAWANRNYRMLYTNMGHNLQSYNDFQKESKTFSCEEQCTLILDAMFGLTAKS